MPRLQTAEVSPAVRVHLNPQSVKVCMVPLWPVYSSQYKHHGDLSLILCSLDNVI